MQGFPFSPLHYGRMLAMGISTANANDVITSLAVRVCVDFTISAMKEIMKGIKKKNKGN